MSKFPAMPLWTDVWLADTRHLTRLERGLYMDLIIEMWRAPNGRIPADRSWVIEHLNIREGEKPALDRVLSEFVKWEKGMWTQKRLQKERKFVSHRRNIARANAKARW